MRRFIKMKKKTEFLFGQNHGGGPGSGKGACPLAPHSPVLLFTRVHKHRRTARTLPWAGACRLAAGDTLLVTYPVHDSGFTELQLRMVR